MILELTKSLSLFKYLKENCWISQYDGKIEICL